MAKKIEDYKELIIDLCNTNESMSKACSKTNLHFNTFKRYAIKLGVYKPNQSGKGIKKNMPKIDLEEILQGKHPHYQTYKLKNRMLREGYIENKCSECEIEDWNDKELNMELDHIDGNKNNHMRNNLRMLCPNCHAQTSTYRAKNILNNQLQLAHIAQLAEASGLNSVQVSVRI